MADLFVRDAVGLQEQVIDTVTELFPASEELCIHRCLRFHAQRIPDTIAIAASGREPLTYSRLLSQIDYVVNILNAAGVGRNDRVAVVLPNGPEMAVAFLAVAAGATCAPLNATYRASEFDFYLSDLNAKALIVPSGTDSSAIAMAQKRGIPVIQLSPVPEAEAGVFTLTSEEGLRPEHGGLGQPTDIALTLHTSGTTSRPKLVPLTQVNICTSAHNSVVALELSSSDRCLNVMPLFHIHGLMAILSSLAIGGSIVCAPNLDLNFFFRCMEEFRPSWYTASPAIHQAILAQAKWNRNVINDCPLRFIRSSSSPLPPKVMAELESIFRAPVIESYAMTEAAYQISSNPLPPGKRKIGSVGVEAGPEIGVMDDSGNLLPHSNTGEIVIRGPNVTQGYENNPAANATSFTGGWFRTGDVGHLDADGYLFITGRLKEIINRGGEKISPREVDEVIMQHPAVAQVATFAVPHPVLGEDVAAAVVLREDTFATEKDVREFAFDRLADFKVPRQIVIVDAIPKGPTGKLQRVGLAEKLGITASSQSKQRTKADYLAPQTPAERALAAIFAQVLDLDRVGIQDNFFELGGHSLLGIYFLARVTSTFGKNLRLRDLYQAPTIEKFANLLRQQEPSLPCTSLIPLQPNGSKPPFFWVHGDNSNAVLHRYLDPDQPLYGFMHQSEDGKPALHTSIEDIAGYYLKELHMVQSVGPYFLGGYSFGGTLAYEMAQQLKGRGEDVALLFLVDSQFPSDELADSYDVLRSVRVHDEAHRHFRNLALLGRREKFTYVRVRVMGMVKDKIDGMRAKISKILGKIICNGYLAMGHPIPISLRGSYIMDIYSQARQNYVPQPYPGRATYIKSEKRSNAHRLEWNKLFVEGMDLYEIPGDHVDMAQEPYVSVWAEHLKSCLRNAHTTKPAARDSEMLERLNVMRDL